MSLASKSSTGPAWAMSSALPSGTPFDDVEQDDVAELAHRGEVGEGSADHSRADQRDLLPSHEAAFQPFLLSPRRCVGSRRFQERGARLAGWPPRRNRAATAGSYRRSDERSFDGPRTPWPVSCESTDETLIFACRRRGARLAPDRRLAEPGHGHGHGHGYDQVWLQRRRLPAWPREEAQRLHAARARRRSSTAASACPCGFGTRYSYRRIPYDVRHRYGLDPSYRYYYSNGYLYRSTPGRCWSSRSSARCCRPGNERPSCTGGLFLCVRFAC